jgi:hypothetical protein
VARVKFRLRVYLLELLSPIFSAQYLRARSMKYSLAIVLALFAFSCNEDDSGDLVLERTVFGLGKSSEDSATKFYYKDTNPIRFDFAWRSVDPKYDANKVEFYIQFNEPYFDKDGNLRVAKHGGEKGILFRTLTGSDMPLKNNPTEVSIYQNDIYELLKNATFDYDGDQSPTPVFSNPAKPGRVAGGYFIEGDEFRLTWALTTKDGSVVDAWPASTCSGSKDSNCSFDWGVKCSLNYDLFIGLFTCDEPGYETYPVSFSKSTAQPNAIVNNNFWDVGVPITYYINSLSKGIFILPQPFLFAGVPHRVLGKGELDTCSGNMSMQYVITNSKGTIVIEENVHHYKKIGG